MKGKRVSLTDKQVEKEIERLSGSEAVALARQEKRWKSPIPLRKPLRR